MLKNVPVNIITGFLGVGKTTAIQQLLKQKPSNQKWAILVNEFGQIGIDQAAFPEEDGVTIKELPGGCICCTLGLPLTMSLVMLLQRAKPDRLIIEPSGIGHPAGIIDILRKEPFADVLDIRATICLVDPRAIEDPKTMAHETFQDQINLADVLVLNKTDLTDPEIVQQMEQKARQMFPPKDQIVRTKQGQFDPGLLDSTFNNGAAAFPNAHTADPESQAGDIKHFSDHQPSEPAPTATPGQPVIRTGNGYGRYSAGWCFHPDEVFDLDRLSNWCRSMPQMERIKGAFRVGEKWVLINQVRGEQVTSPLIWRKDSRLEIISSEPLQLEHLSDELKSLIESR